MNQMSRIIKSSIVLLALLFSFNVSADENPFSSGTGRLRLSEGERETLLQYADNARNLLSQAMSDARGLRDEEKLDIYLTAIRKVVIDSFKDKNRQELVMRMALNQSLELTIGVPTADGRFDNSQALLSSSRNSSLIMTILEDSITIALEFYQDDRFAIVKQDLANLPLMKYANMRVAYLPKWNSAILDMPTSHEFLKTGLQQWLNTAVNPNNLLKVTFAEEITGAEAVLDSVEAAPVGQNMNLLMQQVRYMRLKATQLIQHVSAKAGYLK
jgi:hypothetical protein